MGATDHDDGEHAQNLKFDQNDPQKQTQLVSNMIESLINTISAHKSTIILYLYLLLFTGSIFGLRWINLPRKARSNSYSEPISLVPISLVPETSPPIKEYSLACSGPNSSQKCPVGHNPTKFNQDINSTGNHDTCPRYFKWISKDLKPWKSNGISLEMVEAAKKYAFFRLVVVNGRAYVEKYKDAYQTRDVFTIWGILQLLRLYPGRLPDLDLMFECSDKPVFKKKDYVGLNLSFLPPIFQYCGDDLSYDIVFPDWSFWGWPEINIKPWELQVKDLEEGNRKIKWVDRAPYAYWKGNLHMGQRHYLINCNSTEKWGAQIYSQKSSRNPSLPSEI